MNRVHFLMQKVNWIRSQLLSSTNTDQAYCLTPINFSLDVENCVVVSIYSIC